MNHKLNKLLFKLKKTNLFSSRTRSLLSSVNVKEVLFTLLSIGALVLVLINSVNVLEDWSEKYAEIEEGSRQLKEAEELKAEKEAELELLQTNEYMKIKARDENKVEEGEKIYKVVEEKTVASSQEEELPEEYVPQKGPGIWLSLIFR